MASCRIVVRRKLRPWLAFAFAHCSEMRNCIQKFKMVNQLSDPLMINVVFVTTVFLKSRCRYINDWYLDASYLGLAVELKLPIGASTSSIPSLNNTKFFILKLKDILSIATIQSLANWNWLIVSQVSWAEAAISVYASGMTIPLFIGRR